MVGMLVGFDTGMLYVNAPIGDKSCCDDLCDKFVVIFRRGQGK